MKQMQVVISIEEHFKPKISIQVRLKKICYLLHTESLYCKTYLARALPRRVLEEFFELAKSRL